MDGSLADSGSYFSTEVDWGNNDELQFIDESIINQFSHKVAPVSESFEVDTIENQVEFQPTTIERLADAVVGMHEQKSTARDRVQDVIREFGDMKSLGPSTHGEVDPTMQPILDSMQSSMDRYFEFHGKFQSAGMDYRMVSDMNSWVSTITQSIVSLVKNIVLNTR